MCTKSRGILGIFILIFGLIGCLGDNSFMRNAKISTRIVQTRYGRLQGLLVPMDQHRYLKPVEVFLGVPYATPPVQSNRFSPTRTPSPWDGVRVSDKMGPVCPQRLPNISNETAALDKMPKGRLEYLKRLVPYLRNQSEDCLYLNIFSPAQGSFKPKPGGVGRPRQTRTVEAEEYVLQIVDENASTSVRNLSSKCNITKMIVHDILQEQLLHPYHIQKVHAMSEADYAPSVEFCTAFLERQRTNPTFISDVLFTGWLHP